MKKEAKQEEKNTLEELTTKHELIRAKKEKHCYKLSEEDKQTITLDYYLNRSKQNVEDICNRYNISTRRLYQLVKDERYTKALDGYITQCKNNFSKKTSILIDKAIDKLQDKIDNEDANIKDLTTTIGILYDKNRLEQNLSTSNNSISINIKVER